MLGRRALDHGHDLASQVLGPSYHTGGLDQQPLSSDKVVLGEHGLPFTLRCAREGGNHKVYRAPLELSGLDVVAIALLQICVAPYSSGVLVEQPLEPDRQTQQ